MSQKPNLLLIVTDQQRFDTIHAAGNPHIFTPHLNWLMNTGVSSARLYWDTAQISTGGGFFDVRGVKIPVAVSAFPDEIYAAPRSWAEKAYPKLIYYNKPPKGGHFAAWEQPQLFSEDLRASFRSFR